MSQEKKKIIMLSLSFSILMRLVFSFQGRFEHTRRKGSIVEGLRIELSQGYESGVWGDRGRRRTVLAWLKEACGGAHARLKQTVKGGKGVTTFPGKLELGEVQVTSKQLTAHVLKCYTR